MKSLPLILVLFRAAAAPLLLMDSWDGTVADWFLPLYFLAFLSDIFDGIIARRYEVSTADLRVADSLSDTLLYSCLAIAAWHTHGDLLIANRIPLVSVTLGIGLWMAVNWLKYGKLASYHTYSAKLWGLSLCLATLSIFGNWGGSNPLLLACVFGGINIVEEIAITLILPTWHHDVLSFRHAWQLRQQS
jgi:CDP-diacylglycerol--glycerol-3-phosphate 3-phosphatidyltransferase